MVAETQTLHFSITGESIVELAREQVMCREYDKAIKTLTDSLHGMTVDYAVQLLTGEYTLTGVDSDIRMEKDDISDTRYEEQLNYLFGDVIKIENEWYKPYGYVDRFNEDDRKATNSDELTERAMHYADNKSDKVLFLMTDINGVKCERCVVYKQVVVPFWYTVADRLPQDTVRPHHLEDLGHWTDEQNQIQVIKSDVLQQNWSYFQNEMYEFDFGDGVGVRQVPLGPLKMWALRRTNYKFKGMEWKPVSESGFKMLMDDPSHTDWMIGAGIDLDFYNESEFRSKQYVLMSEIQEKYMNYKVTVLLSGAPAVGNIVFPEPNAPVSSNQIAIIPHAGVEYMNAFLTAAAVITEAGGAMSHLSVNGLEYNKQLVRIEGARHKFTEGAAVCIQDGSIEVMIS